MTKDEALKQALSAMRCAAIELRGLTPTQDVYEAIRAAETALAESESRATTHNADCWSYGRGHYECAMREIERLRTALAESEQEPVAWQSMYAGIPVSETHDPSEAQRWRKEKVAVRSLFASPVRAEPLTDEELRECFTSTNTSQPLEEGWPGLERFARAVERKLRGKA